MLPSVIVEAHEKLGLIRIDLKTAVGRREVGFKRRGARRDGEAWSFNAEEEQHRNAPQGMDNPRRSASPNG